MLPNGKLKKMKTEEYPKSLPFVMINPLQKTPEQMEALFVDIYNMNKQVLEVPKKIVTPDAPTSATAN